MHGAFRVRVSQHNDFVRLVPPLAAHVQHQAPAVCPQVGQVRPVQLDVPIPDLSVDATELASLYRLDLQTARDQIEDAQRAVQVAKNGLLPDLDVTARGSIGNPQDTPASHIGSRTAEYSAAVTLDWPLDRLRERNIYRRALIALERFGCVGGEAAQDLRRRDPRSR